MVAECDDSFLSDSRRMQVSAADVRAALEAARAAGAAAARPPAEGAVGAGTGMSCLGFKGGIGTASRLVPSGHTVGVLALTNFGDQDRLTIDGVPVGRMLPPDPAPAAARAGRLVHHGRGHRRARWTPPPAPGWPGGRAWAWPGPARPPITAAGRSSWRWPPACGWRAARARRPTITQLAGRDLDPFFAAVVEATEEAVLNSLLAAPTVTGRDGNTSRGLPAATVRRLLTDAGRIDPPPANAIHAPPGPDAGCSL